MIYIVYLRIVNERLLMKINTYSSSYEKDIKCFIGKVFKNIVVDYYADIIDQDPNYVRNNENRNMIYFESNDERYLMYVS